MSRKPRKEPQPILIIKNFALRSWKNKTEDIYLNPKGNIFGSSFTIKDYSRNRNYEAMYRFTEEYLNLKRKKYDVTDIHLMSIGDLRQMMWDKNMKSISRKRIEEIVHTENPIGKIKNMIINRVKKYLTNHQGTTIQTH